MQYNYLSILDHMEYIPESTLEYTVTIMEPKKIDRSKKVEVYFNLHKKCWSVRQAGVPVVHTDFIEIKDPQFVVQQGGNARVRREKKKNVHAFVRGYLTNRVGIFPKKQKLVTYNPYKHTSFVERGSEKPICSAEYAVLDITDKKPLVEALWF